MGNLHLYFKSAVFFLVSLLTAFSVSGAVVNGNLSINKKDTETIDSDIQFTGYLDIMGTLTIKSGNTLIIGTSESPQYATFHNISKITIEPGASLIIYGNLTNENNSTDVIIDGDIFVFGNVMNGNGGSMDGSGGLTATGYYY